MPAGEEAVDVGEIQRGGGGGGDEQCDGGRGGEGPGGVGERS